MPKLLKIKGIVVALVVGALLAVVAVGFAATSPTGGSKHACIRDAGRQSTASSDRQCSDSAMVASVNSDVRTGLRGA